MTVRQANYIDEDEETPAKRRCILGNLSNYATASVLQRSTSNMPSAISSMTNGYGFKDNLYYNHGPQADVIDNDLRMVSVAPLVNVGNTCFLNSVLYTLRFAPTFIHKLHHLHIDLESFLKRMHSNKTIDKGPFLDKNVKFGSSSNECEFSSRMSPSFITRVQTVSKLHQLYCSMFDSESKDRVEPVQPNTFVQCLREVNPFFEGNQQQDAHELLVCILDIIREVCETVYCENNDLEKSVASNNSAANSSIVRTMKQKLFKKRGRRTNASDGDIKKFLINGSFVKEESGSLEDEPLPDNIIDDFRGISLLRTKCLECEQVTERKETVCDICVPIETLDNYEDQESVDRLYQSIIVTEEFLMDNNKYWCEKCCRYNEAMRCVRYQKMPRLLTLHLKRFSSNFGTTVQKLTNHMPTPFKLACFCEECLKCGNEERDKPHFYSLFAFITHCGTTLASGHYVAVVKAVENREEYILCQRDKAKTSSLSRNASASSLLSSSNSSLLDKPANGISKFFSNTLSSKSFCYGSNPTKSKESNFCSKSSPCKGFECCSLKLRDSVHSNDDAVWLQCDDEKIEIVTAERLAEMLSPQGSEADNKTPYLLFYSRVDVY